jgi:hypothetical protein
MGPTLAVGAHHYARPRAAVLSGRGVRRLRSRSQTNAGRGSGKADFRRWDGAIRESLAAFEALPDPTCPDREFGSSVFSNTLDPAQKTARSRRMDIDVIGMVIS